MKKKTIFLSFVFLLGLGILFVSVNNAKAGIIDCALAMDDGEGCKSGESVCYYTLKATGEKCVIDDSDFRNPSEEEEEGSISQQP